MNITDVFAAGVDTPKALKAIANGIASGTICAHSNPEKQVILIFTHDSQAEGFIKATGIKTDVCLANCLKYHLLKEQPDVESLDEALCNLGHLHHFTHNGGVWVQICA